MISQINLWQLFIPMFLDAQDGYSETIAATGDWVPDNNGILDTMGNRVILNDPGQVAFTANLSGSSGGALDDSAIFVGSIGLGYMGHR